MDILQMALTLEHDLELYYKEQAELNKDNTLNVVFTMLSKEEANHALLLKNTIDHTSYPLEDSKILEEARTLFKNMDDFALEITEHPSQLDSYRMALEKEEQSFAFYQEHLDSTQDEHSKKVFAYLLKQEDDHRIILEELIKLLTRPEEWVESAEFGVREDY